jgi:hypothetical protein
MALGKIDLRSALVSMDVLSAVRRISEPPIVTHPDPAPPESRSEAREKIPE